jgi:phosphoribosylamine--glycine ligase
LRILVIGSGGREHALAWKIAQSPLTEKLYCAPGNAGMAEIAECVDVAATDIDGLLALAFRESIHLTVVGPEAPLAIGIVDRFQENGMLVFGPTAAAAEIESSKQFSKQLMQQAGIPTAAFWLCDSHQDARAVIQNWFETHPSDSRLVIKADGLAAGKGVVVAQGQSEATEAVNSMMADRVFGSSGDKIVIEECLYGEEASIMAITDGETVLPLIPSQDHKRIFEGDQGPNTGGMGAYTPVPAAPQSIVDETLERIIKPAVRALAAMGRPYRGALYAGIMITEQGPQTIEFNCRLGDPETETILPLLETDLVPVLTAAATGSLAGTELRWRSGAAVCVVAASGGYPGSYQTGLPITGLEEVAGNADVVAFHAGTRLLNGKTVTAGGRVLAVTGTGADIKSAAGSAYAALDCIQFDGIYYRRDIGWRVLAG